MIMHNTLLTLPLKGIRSGKVWRFDSATSPTIFIFIFSDPNLGAIEPNYHRWTPLPLRPQFWIPFYLFMVLLAVGLEIALHFSNKQHGMSLYRRKSFSLYWCQAPGWKTYSAATTDYGFMHYVYASESVSTHDPGSSNKLLLDIPTHHRGHDDRSDGRADRYRDQENATIYRSGRRGLTTADESSTRLYTQKVSKISTLMIYRYHVKMI